MKTKTAHFSVTPPSPHQWCFWVELYAIPLYPPSCHHLFSIFLSLSLSCCISIESSTYPLQVFFFSNRDLSSYPRFSHQPLRPREKPLQGFNFCGPSIGFTKVGFSGFLVLFMLRSSILFTSKRLERRRKLCLYDPYTCCLPLRGQRENIFLRKSGILQNLLSF